MSKIVRAANAMITNENKISNVIPGPGGEIFFIYDATYKWSIKYDSEEGCYRLYYYPDNKPIEALAAMVDDDWRDVNIVHYNSKDIGTKEADETFKELHMRVQERLYGVNEVLDNIIGSTDVPF